MDEFLYELKLYERLGREIMEAEGIRREEVELALTGLGGADPRFYPIAASGPLDHERSWYAFAILDAVYEARRLYSEGAGSRAMAAMFSAGVAYMSAVVGLHFPETRQKLDRLRQSRGGRESGKRRNEDNKERNENICKAAKELLAAGRKNHDICSMISGRKVADGLSTRQVREILQSEGVLQKKKRK